MADTFYDEDIGTIKGLEKAMAARQAFLTKMAVLVDAQSDAAAAKPQPLPTPDAEPKTDK